MLKLSSRCNLRAVPVDECITILVSDRVQITLARRRVLASDNHSNEYVVGFLDQREFSGHGIESSASAIVQESKCSVLRSWALQKCRLQCAYYFYCATHAQGSAKGRHNGRHT